ncbi:ER membrane protein complex subunit 2 [Cricetulus griseus]
MRKWREENSRNSEQIMEVGEELINDYASKLGDDIWIIYEQVMIAALDYGRDDLALFCLQELRRQFPGSHGVKRLTGMRFEAMERCSPVVKYVRQLLSVFLVCLLSRCPALLSVNEDADMGFGSPLSFGKHSQLWGYSI